MKSKRISALLLAAAVVLTATLTARPACAAENKVAGDTVASEHSVIPDYEAYKELYAGAEFTKENIVLDGSASDSFTGSKKGSPVSGTESFPVLEAGDTVSWHVSAASDALYTASLSYCALPGRGLDCTLSLLIDGVSPFSGAEDISLTRAYRDVSTAQKDSNGNEILPEQEEVFLLRTKELKASSGFSDEAMRLYLPAGEHEITLLMVSESIAVGALTLSAPEELPSYREYSSSANPEDTANELVITQAENPLYKSHSMICATSDYSSPATVPSDPVKIRLNTIGQMNWKYSGQWISWTLHTEKAGWYRLVFKYRQDFVRGLSSARRLTINGKTPFAEADCIYFDYTYGFENLILSDKDGNACLFYLEKGDNELSLEVRLGGVSEVLTDAQAIVTELNAMYRSIIMITGTHPDTLRDYYLDRDLPEMLPTFRDCAGRLRSCVEKLNDNGNVGSEGAFFEKLAAQLESFVKKPETVQKRLDSYKNNVSTLASTILSFKEQPLELDYIAAAGARAQLPRASAGFLENLLFRTKSFIGSFTEDYNAVGMTGGGDKKTPITVWANGEATGRDQLALINRLIENDFAKNHDISVSLRLVGTGQVLTQAVLAGAGPDIALIVPETMPVNLAMRGALADLSKLSGFSEIKDWFYPSAFIPYMYEGGIYGMPETQTFSMQFCRTDIFDELGLTPPETWNDFFITSAVLQKSKLEIGIPESVGMFETLLLQNGKSYYNDSHTKTVLDSAEALDAFITWTSLYSDYSYPLNFDAYNRFRTGEMPLVIMPTSFYNQLVAAAPEIKGKWSMQPIPGNERDGIIDRTQSCTGTCAVMLADVSSPESGFEFIRWWVSAGTQGDYGNQIEAQLGAAARYAAANREAFKKLAWTAAEQETLTEQWEQVDDMPVVPGDYYVSRNLANAFRRVVYYSETPREVLGRYNAMINKEIVRKRREYGLDAGN